ncbi:MAG: hypothetical protein RL088_1152 [Verrucomicrobiota bacterium]|jgi:hypothetical protein
MARALASSLNRFKALAALLLVASGLAFAAPIERVPVDSSNLKSVGFDEKSRVLEIQFHHGGIYRYHDVPAETHAALMKAESKGRYFQTNIRNKFRFEKVAAEK